MKKNKLINYIIAILVMAVSCMFSEVAFAEGIGFAVDPIFSNKQIDKSKDFYYLLTKPGEEQIIELAVTSTQKEPISIKITPQYAWTQSNGQMGYTDDLELLDESLKEPLTSMFELDEDIITVSNYEIKQVKIKLRAPNEHYDGIKAGALTFSLAQEEGESEKGVGVNYAVRIGVMTSESGDSYSDGNDLLLNSAKATVINSHKVVVGRLQNPQPKMLVNLNIEGNIVEENTKKIIKKKKMNSITMAPNSFMDYEFDWGIDTMPAGNFIMTINGENGEDSWVLTKKFTITGKQAKKVNDASVFKIVTENWIKVVAIILGSIAGINSSIVIVRLGKRKKRWKKLQIKRKKKKKGRSRG